LLRQKMALGFDFQKALEDTRRQIVFTTHTPEMTGSETYDIDTMMEIGCFPQLSREQASFLGGNPFSLTVASLKMAKVANAVSQLHGQVADRLWAWVQDRCPIISVTNGVDTDFWHWLEIKMSQTPEEIEKAKAIYKELLLDYIREQSGKLFDKNVLTIVWARRFAEYKRPWLLFYNRDWFRELLESGLIQIIYAGKPHPADLSMINVWNEIWQMSKEFKNLVILPGYDLEMSKILKGGADLWLNTPRRPREACGTSWMSAMMNCTLVLSSRDGGAIEGIDATNGFLFGVDNPSGIDADQDNRDFQSLQSELQSAMAIFYQNKTRWYTMALAGRKTAEQGFSSDRMLGDYISQLYNSDG
ncbi:MAG: glycogen/starch/alpha-glucan phosphorylase, partial [bacterium]|nr:glycogen/starch/alpha-glucan phosphorylase [bacterium]